MRHGAQAAPCAARWPPRGARRAAAFALQLAVARARGAAGRRTRAAPSGRRWRSPSPESTSTARCRAGCGDRSRPVSSGRACLPTPRRPTPRRPRSQYRHHIEVERGTELRDELRQRVVGAASVPPRAASVSASARARCASAVRRPRDRRSAPTTPATTRKMTSASMFSALSIVNVWSGGVKYQLTSAKPSTAPPRRERSRRARPRPRR